MTEPLTINLTAIALLLALAAIMFVAAVAAYCAIVLMIAYTRRTLKRYAKWKPKAKVAPE